MKATLVGISHYDFVNDAGERVEGDKLHVLRPADPDDKSMLGRKVDVIGVPKKAALPALTLDTDYNFYFDKGAGGKAVLVDIVPANRAAATPIK